MEKNHNLQNYDDSKSYISKNKEKIIIFLDNKKLSEQMGEAGRKFIQETFSTESMAKTFVDIIKPYLKNK